MISIAVRASRLCLKLKEPWLFSKPSYFSWLVYLLKMRVKGSTVIDKNKRFGMLSDYMRNHRAPTQPVCVADCYFIVNVLDLPFASPIAIYC